MKRFVLLLVCATVFVCLLAAPAADAKSAANQQTYRPPVGAAILDGWSVWVEYSGVTGTFADVTWHQASDPVCPRDPWWRKKFKPIPMNDKAVYVCFRTAGVDYGYMLNTPDRYVFTVDITGPGGFEQHFRPGGVDTDVDGDKEVEEVIDSKAYWTGPYVWDQFWIDYWYDSWGEYLPPPTIGALLYGQDLMLPIRPFEVEGRYDVHYSWVTATPLNELIWKVYLGRPYHEAPGGQGGDEWFSFYVE